MHFNQNFLRGEITLKFDFSALADFLMQLFNAIKALFEAITGSGNNNENGENEEV